MKHMQEESSKVENSVHAVCLLHSSYYSVKLLFFIL